MILNSRFTFLTRHLHDSYFLKENSTGIHYMKYDSNKGFSLDEEQKYGEIFNRIRSGELFLLENIFIKDRLLQRVTFPKDNSSYIRLAKKTSLDVGEDFNKSYENDGYDFSVFILENLKETDQGVIDVLQNTSKVSMRDNLVLKVDEHHKRFFKYKKRTSLNKLNNELETGFYSVIEYKYDSNGRINDDFIDSVLLNNIDINLYRRIRGTLSNYRSIDGTESNPRSRPSAIDREVLYKESREISFNGVLEVYNTPNYIFQFLYVSFPFVSQMNRFYDKSRNGWSGWRHVQYLYDYHPTVMNSAGTYLAKRPIKNVNLRISGRDHDPTHYNPDYRYVGYKDKEILREWKTRFTGNVNPFNVAHSPFITIHPFNDRDYSYGYLSPYTSRIAELGYYRYHIGPPNYDVIDPPLRGLFGYGDEKYNYFNKSNFFSFGTGENPNITEIRNPFYTRQYTFSPDYSTILQGIRFNGFREFYPNRRSDFYPYVISNKFIGYISGINFLMDNMVYDINVRRRFIEIDSAGADDVPQYIDIDRR